MTKTETILRRNLLTLARAYAEHSGLMFSSISSYANGDRRFFDNLSKKIEPSTFTTRSYDRAIEYFEKKWPAELAWPTLKPVPGHEIRRK